MTSVIRELQLVDIQCQNSLSRWLIRNRSQLSGNITSGLRKASMTLMRSAPVEKE